MYSYGPIWYFWSEEPAHPELIDWWKLTQIGISYHSVTWQDIKVAIILVTEFKLNIVNDSKWDRRILVADLGRNIWMMLDGITTNI